MSRFIVRTSAFFVFFFTLSSNTYSQDYDVRKTYWGMSPLEVQLSETGKLTFDGTAGNYHMKTYRFYKLRNGLQLWNADYDYYFQRNKLVKVIFSLRWKKEELSEYNQEKEYYTKKAGKPTRTVDNQKYKIDEWILENRTFIKLYLEKKPNEHGFYYFNTQFVEVGHKKELDAKKK